MGLVCASCVSGDRVNGPSGGVGFISNTYWLGIN